MTALRATVPLALLAALAVAPSLAQQRPPPSAETVLRGARELKESGRPADALAVLNAHITRTRGTANLDLAVIRLEAARAAIAAQQPGIARGHAVEAARLIERLRPEPILRARLHREIARLHERLGDPRRAEPVLRAALDGLRARDPAAAAEAANALGAVLIDLARPRPALVALEDSLNLLWTARLTGEPVLAALVNMTNAHLEAGQVEQARDAADRARVAADGEAPLMRLSDFAQAQVSLRESNLVAAESLLSSLAREAEGGGLRGHALQLLATSRFNRGRHPEAAEAAFAALEAYRTSLGEAHPAFGRALHTLGTIQAELGAPAAATALLERAAAVARASFGADTIQIHLSQIEIAAIEVREPNGVPAAERRARAALAVFQHSGLPDRRPEALATVVLGLVAERREQVDAAATAFRRAQHILEVARGSDSPDLGFSLVRLGRLLTNARRFDEAGPPLDRAIALYERLGGAGTVRLSEALTARAELRARAGDRRGALDQIRRAHALLSDRVASGEASGGSEETQRRGVQALFAAQANLLNSLQDVDPRALEEAFAASQESLTSRAGEALRLSSFRMMSGAGPAASLLRAQSEVAEALRQTDALILQTAAQGGAELQRLRALRSEQARKLEEAGRTLAEDEPRLASFLRPTPASLADVRAVLEEDEAVLAPVVSDEGTLLWVITRGGAHAHQVSLGRQGLSALVDRIRRTLDTERQEGPPPFDADAAKALHDSLIAPAETTGALERAQHLIIVPDGALQRLPPHLLQSRDGEWLLRRYATTVSPSLASFASSRRAARMPSSAPLALLGVGNPTLGGYAPGGAASRGIPASLRDGLSGLRALPDTEVELRALAEVLGRGESLLLMGMDATEQRLTEAGPSSFRNLAFATHAVMAGEVPGLAEPAVILTPDGSDAPMEGLLTASDVAAMELDADLVLLSACNTAAPEAGPYSEGLSGLARAFLQAGARRLLVSHWAVNSQAAALVTTAFMAARQADPDGRPAASLRAAILRYTTDERMGHPAYWAPFVLVGS